MLVSIIIPTYNREAIIGAAVESALRQTYPNKEIIVVDDGSKDHTLEVLKTYGSSITVIAQSNGGPSMARNRGVMESKGEIVSFLDSDDFWHPEKIEKQVRLMTLAGNVMPCCVCNAEIRGISGEVISHSFKDAGICTPVSYGEWLNPGEVLATSFLLFNQVVAVRRAAFDAVKGFNEDLRLLEDYEMALKLSSLGKWGIISEPLVVKRNDTEGIGVECLKDHAKHLETCVNVIHGFLTGNHLPQGRARKLLEGSLKDLRSESKAAKMAQESNLLSKIAGKGLGFMVRLNKALKRRHASWPRPVVHPL